MAKTTLTYKPLDKLTDEEIQAVLNSDDIAKLIRLPLSVGMNHHDWKFAQDLCIKLSTHSDLRVRANALTGLEYIARTKGKLEKHLVKPILLNALRDEKWEQLGISSVIKKINFFLNWKVGIKAVDKKSKAKKE